MSTVSTHVLDAAVGRPAVGLEVALQRTTTAGAEVVERATTDDDGRVRFSTDVGPGPHALVVATGRWFAAAGRDTFFPQVHLAFEVDPGLEHHHVALLLSPYSYTTYRGS